MIRSDPCQNSSILKALQLQTCKSDGQCKLYRRQIRSVAVKDSSMVFLNVLILSFSIAASYARSSVLRNWSNRVVLFSCNFYVMAFYLKTLLI